jgi:hypothetical protein
MLGAASTCLRISCEGGAEQSCAHSCHPDLPGMSADWLLLPAARSGSSWLFLFRTEGLFAVHPGRCAIQGDGIIDAVDAFSVEVLGLGRAPVPFVKDRSVAVQARADRTARPPGSTEKCVHPASGCRLWMTSADRGTATMSGLQSLGQVTVLNDGSYLCNSDIIACSRAEAASQPLL